MKKIKEKIALKAMDIKAYIAIRILAPLVIWIVSRIPSILLFILGASILTLFVVNALATTTPKDTMFVLLFVGVCIFAISIWGSFALWRRSNRE